MKLQIGDKIVLRYDDSVDNQEIIGKELVVIKPSMNTSPFWVDVSYNGKYYSVRGSDCNKVT